MERKYMDRREFLKWVAAITGVGEGIGVAVAVVWGVAEGANVLGTGLREVWQAASSRAAAPTSVKRTNLRRLNGFDNLLIHVSPCIQTPC